MVKYYYCYNVIHHPVPLPSPSLSLSLPPSLSLSLLQGIGDSGQGFANAILFVLFTPKVRRYFLRLLLCHCLWKKSRNQINIQNTAKIYYGTVPSNSDYKSFEEISEPPTVCSVSEGLALNKGKV